MTEQGINWKHTHESYVATHEGYTIEVSRDLQGRWHCYVWEGTQKVGTAGNLPDSTSAKQKAVELVNTSKS